MCEVTVFGEEEVGEGGREEGEGLVEEVAKG